MEAMASQRECTLSVPHNERPTLSPPSHLFARNPLHAAASRRAQSGAAFKFNFFPPYAVCNRADVRTRSAALPRVCRTNCELTRHRRAITRVIIGCPLPRAHQAVEIEHHRAARACTRVEQAVCERHHGDLRRRQRAGHDQMGPRQDPGPTFLALFCEWCGHGHRTRVHQRSDERSDEKKPPFPLVAQQRGASPLSRAARAQAEAARKT